MFKLLFAFLGIICAYAASGQLTADFYYATPGDSCQSRTVQLNAGVSTGNITSYQWSFRNKTTGQDLGSGTGLSITRNFLAPGVYEVTLTVSDGVTNDQKVTEIHVYENPIVDFEVDAREGCPPLDVKFTDHSLAGSGVIEKWEWNYNDGKKDVFLEQVAPLHRYASKGNYTPTLIVTNSAGCTGSLSKPDLVKVYDKITPSFLVTDNYSCELPHTVSFENTSPATSNFTFQWDFGDGNTLESDEEWISHEYTAPGIYSIKIKAVNETGNCSTVTSGSGLKNVYVGKPEASLPAIPSQVCENTRLLLQSVADPTGISNQGRWLFGDDNTVVNGKSVYHTFSKPGVWTIKYVNFNTNSGCFSDTVEHSIEVLPSPVADFTVDMPDGCQIPHTVHFTNTSLYASEYLWSFGDGATSVSPGDIVPARHDYTAFRNYSVSLKATNEAGCSATKTFNYIRNVKPTLKAEMSVEEGCSPLPLKVKSIPTSNDPVRWYIYDFGDGRIDTLTTPEANHAYVGAGSYMVNVKLVTVQGCEAIAEPHHITVNEFCDDDGSGGGGGGGGGGGISLERDPGCDGRYTFTFRDTVQSAEIISWDFDGDLIAGNTNPITYTFPDDQGKKRFLVTSVALNPETSEIYENKIRVVVVDEKADFVADKENICKGLEVRFATLDIDSSHIVSYTWDFGDSSARKIIDNKAYYQRYEQYLNGDASHVYQDTGVFYPKLVIEDKFGCKDSMTYPAPIVVKGPKARFTVDTASFCSDDFEVVFSDSSEANGATPIVSRRWTWDAGATLVLDRDTVITRAYKHNQSYRKYSPSLVVTDALGCTDTYSLDLHSYAPKANFVTSDTLRCGKFNINFSNRSQAYISNYNRYVWKYGDGKTSTGNGGSHVYPDTGFYSVTLVVTDDGGCVDSITRSDYVKLVKPVADFDIGSDTSKCVGTFSLPFTSTSQYGRLYSWDFGDGEASVSENIEVSHYYKVAGVYDARLIVTGIDGCVDTTIKKVRIKGPVGKLHVDDTYLCTPDSLSARVEGDNIAEYFWDMGDLSSTIAWNKSPDIRHKYAKAGYYTPNVILLSPEGCQITLSWNEPVVVDSVYAGPDANIECGETGVGLDGYSALGLDSLYYWTGPPGALSAWDEASAKVWADTAGIYVLQSKIASCTMQDTARVTSSGIVPDADAGAGQRIDCISGKASLSGVSNTNDIRYEWQGPPGATFFPHGTIGDPVVSVPGEYVLTVFQKECFTSDTVWVVGCSLNPMDTAIGICANVDAGVAIFDAYDLTGLEEYVKGGVMSNVDWFHDEDFISPVSDPVNEALVDRPLYYVRIKSGDGLETARALVKFEVYDYVKADFDDLPIVCEWSDTIVLTGAFPSGGLFYGDFVFDDSLVAPGDHGIYTIWYKYESEKGCVDSLGKVLDIKEAPHPPAVMDTVRYCQDVVVLPDLSVSPASSYTVRWRDALERPLPGVPLAGRWADTTLYWVGQSSAYCASPWSPLVVLVDSVPERVVVTDTVRYCQDVVVLPDLSVSPASSYTVRWRDALGRPLPGVPLAGRWADTTLYWVGQSSAYCASPWSPMVVLVDSTPAAPLVYSPLTLCEGDSYILRSPPLSDIMYEWRVISNEHNGYDYSLRDSFSIVAAQSPMSGWLVLKTSPGCESDTTRFAIEVDLLPDQALVNGEARDTLRVCLAESEVELRANVPGVGTGEWRTIYNSGGAWFDHSEPVSSLREFDTMDDTLEVEWIVSNGVCPETKASLRIEPVEAFYPEVTLSGPKILCEGDIATVRVEPGLAAGASPQYAFYTSAGELLQPYGSSPVFSMSPRENAYIYARLHADYPCLYQKYVNSDTVLIEVLEKPRAEIGFSRDTICETDSRIEIWPARSGDANVTYQWYKDGVMIYEGKEPGRYTLGQPEESGLYVLRVHNEICPSDSDSHWFKIYEQPYAFFDEERLEVTYAPGKLTPVALIIDPVEKDSISAIEWYPRELLSYHSDGAYLPVISGALIRNPYYTAQNEDVNEWVVAAVHTGMNGKGCVTEATLEIRNYLPVNIPNAFSPNGDGLNDVWVIRGIEKYPQTRVKVFNRWGNILFEDNKGYRTCWDGTSSGVKVPVGTYYYVVDFLGSNDDSDYSDSGWLFVAD